MTVLEFVFLVLTTILVMGLSVGLVNIGFWIEESLEEARRFDEYFMECQREHLNTMADRMKLEARMIAAGKGGYRS